MKMRWQFLLASAVAVLLGGSATAQETNCSGTVTDAAGHPLAGATVEYWRYEGNPLLANFLVMKRQIATGTNGAFEFQVSRATGILLARKPGLAPDWRTLGQQFEVGDKNERHLVLTTPGTLAGVVVDDADRPVSNAVVSVALARLQVSLEEGGTSYFYLSGKPALDCFPAHVDAAGHFRIENFPTNASASLRVQAPGKTLRQSSENSSGMNFLPWCAGQQDIKLVLEPAGIIEGKIVVEGGNQPPPLAQLALQPSGPRAAALADREPVQSGADGVFDIGDVPDGTYQIHAVFGTNAIADWVADVVPVSVQTGETTRGVEVTATRGGLLEVSVLGQDDRKPLAHIVVNAYKSGFQTAASSDSNGLARLRLPPGDYQLIAARESRTSSRTTASVEAGTTNRAEMEIPAPKKITGIVHQPDGQPAAGLTLRVIGAFGAGMGDVKTDAGGKFELEWNDPSTSRANSIPCLLVRDAERNLAVAQEIDEDTGPLDLKLAPGLTLSGKVQCDGKPVTNATAAVVFWTGNSGMNITGWNRATNTPGRFEIPALPPGRKYGIVVSAPGYGQHANYNVGASEEAERMELDPFDLKPANLKLAGEVLDADDKPVAGVNVNLNGEGQPNGNTTTDRQGRFHFDQVCEGTVRVMANSQSSYGNVAAEGGDTNVVVRLGETFNSSEAESKPHKLTGTVTDSEGKPAAGAQVAVFPSETMPAPWKKAAANGAFSLTWALEPYQIQSGGGALLVARDPARNLAATEDLDEETTNIEVKLKAALTITGLVKNMDDSPLAGAQVGVWLKAGNSYETLNEQESLTDAQGRYEIKCLPPEAQYMVFASAKGHGRIQRQVAGDSDTNRLEQEPFVLKLANQVLAGQVINEDDKPVSGANVQLNGGDQPEGNVTTDSKGRFHFQVCEGRVQLFAYSQQGGSVQGSAEAGDTNVVLTLRAQGRNVRMGPARAPLTGKPLPDLAGMNLAGDAAPANLPVLLCLFDAGQRSSRHTVQQLGEKAAALRQQGVTVLGVQAAITADETLNDWKSASPVTFPLGRVTEKPGTSKWAATVPALPWLILTDASHRVIAEGFPLDDLDAQIKKVAR